MDRFFSRGKIKTRQIIKYEKKYKKSLGKMIELDGMSYTQLIELVQMLADCSEDVACELFDEFMLSHTYADAILQVYYELDKDTGLLKMANMTIEDLKAKIDTPNNDNSQEKLDNDEVVLRPGEIPKVDKDGNVTLD